MTSNVAGGDADVADAGDPVRMVALVTGSGTGVGAATALALARRGYDLVLNCSRSEAEAHESEAACRAAGARTVLVQADVAEAIVFLADGAATVSGELLLLDAGVYLGPSPARLASSGATAQGAPR